MSEWREKQFGECADLVRETVSPAQTSGIPYIGLEHIAEGALSLNGVGTASDVTSLKSCFRSGDVLFGKLRPYFRKIVRPSFDGVCSTDIWVVRPKGDMDAGFLFYWMASKDFVDASMRGSEGTKMPRAKWDFIEKIKKSVPPVQEQRAIAHILGTLDDKIELNRRTNETLEAIARALFKSWFVDFDPVRAKMSGEPPESICQRLGLTPELLALFSDRLVDSELGEIPEGWKDGRISDVAGLLSGYAFKSKDWVENGVPVVKIGSVKPGIVDLSAVSFVTATVADQAKRFRLCSGDLLIGMTGYVGEVGLVPPTDNLPLLNQRVGRFVLENSGAVEIAFLYCLTRAPEFKDAVVTKSHGTAQANVSAEGILSIPIVVPPRGLRDAFNQICHPLFVRILENHAETNTLSISRDALLPKLLSGELRVPTLGNVSEECLL